MPVLFLCLSVLFPEQDRQFRSLLLLSSPGLKPCRAQSGFTLTTLSGLGLRALQGPETALTKRVGSHHALCKTRAKQQDSPAVLQDKDSPTHTRAGDHFWGQSPRATKPGAPSLRDLEPKGSHQPDQTTNKDKRFLHRSRGLSRSVCLGCGQSCAGTSHGSAVTHSLCRAAST